MEGGVVEEGVCISRFKENFCLKGGRVRRIRLMFKNSDVKKVYGVEVGLKGEYNARYE